MQLDAPVDGEAHGRAAHVVPRQHHRQRVRPLDWNAVLDRVCPITAIRHLHATSVIGLSAAFMRKTCQYLISSSANSTC